MAGYLSLHGHDVAIYNRSEARIRPIQKKGGIKVKGLIKGFAKVELCAYGDSIGKVIRDADVIMAVVPATAHRFLAEQCAPHLEDDQLIVLNPGRTGGALEFANIVATQQGLEPLVAEAQSYAFVSRATGPNEATITGIKKELRIGALPACETGEAVDRVGKLLPNIIPAENVLETSINNIGAIFHPAPLILNIGRAESTCGAYNHYVDGISPAVARFMEQLDAERVAIGNALGVAAISAVDWLEKSYGSRGNFLYEKLQRTKSYQGLGAPQSLDHRYIWEDIPTGLVPLSSLGGYLNVATPSIDAVIQMANALCQRDFVADGRTVTTLGIDNLSIDGLLTLVREGHSAIDWNTRPIVGQEEYSDDHWNFLDRS
jgi:opine dehydrogenase